jgi:hypothetical protein
MNWRPKEQYNESIKQRGFFEKKNNIDKPLVKVAKRRWEWRWKRGYYSKMMKFSRALGNILKA